jgi:hypothetical protein
MNARSTRSVRLIFEYDGDQIRLIKQQDVEMVPPPSEPTSGFAEEDGFWLEVRDAGMKVLHQQNVVDPIAIYPETFSNVAGETVARSNEPSRKGAFTVVVPETPENDHLAFVRAKPVARPTAEERAPESAPSGEIARFSIKKSR